jgi:hypothetical protein
MSVRTDQLTFHHATSFTTISHRMALDAYILPNNFTVGMDDSARK